MQLPNNASEISDKFKELDADRKQQIITHLASAPDASGKALVDTLIANGGIEAKFVAQLFGKTLPGKKDSPQNKAVNPIHTK